jgi:lipoate-protein ligase A
LLDSEGRPGAENMAVDIALLAYAAATSTATLRLYRFNPPCLSFGRHEPALRRYDRARIERLGIDVVRRPTGGRAVWHEHEVTYSVTAPLALFGSLRDAYCAIHTRLAQALGQLGVPAVLAPTSRHTPPPRPDARGSCFAAAVGGEIVARGRKLVGSAQLEDGTGTAFLQHGSILLDITRQDVLDFQDATSLSGELGRPIGFHEVAEHVIKSWGVRLEPTALDRPLPLVTARFKDSSWTWRR